MRALPFAVLLILGGIGAWWGWRVGTRAIYRRSDDAMDSPFTNPAMASPRLSRLKRQRIVLAVFFGWAGIAAGAAGMIYLVR
jgi:hypothetical protein